MRDEPDLKIGGIGTGICVVIEDNPATRANYAFHSPVDHLVIRGAGSGPRESLLYLFYVKSLQIEGHDKVTLRSLLSDNVAVVENLVLVNSSTELFVHAATVMIKGSCAYNLRAAEYEPEVLKVHPDGASLVPPVGGASITARRLVMDDPSSTLTVGSSSSSARLIIKSTTNVNVVVLSGSAIEVHDKAESLTVVGGDLYIGKRATITTLSLNCESLGIGADALVSDIRGQVDQLANAKACYIAAGSDGLLVYDIKTEPSAAPRSRM